jgi:cytoskeletal protein RodZ
MQEQLSVKVWFYSVLFLLTFMHTHVAAQSQAAQQDEARQRLDGAVQATPAQNPSSQNSQNQNTDSQEEQTNLSPLSDLGDEYTNSIELLRNRFRVDYNVEEVTMVFF